MHCTFASNAGLFFLLHKILVYLCNSRDSSFVTFNTSKGSVIEALSTGKGVGERLYRELAVEVVPMSIIIIYLNI